MSSNGLAKYEWIADQLRRQIASGQLSGNLPGVKQLALDYDANFMTVNKALNRLVKENLVFRIARKGTYVRQQKNIALVFYDPSPSYTEEPFYAPLIYQVQRECAARHSFMIYDNLYSRTAESIASLVGRIDGLLMVGSNKGEYAERYFEGKPCVCVLGLVDESARHDHVTYETARVGAMAAEYLRSLGHRRVAYLGYTHIPLFRERRDTFRSTAAEAGAAVFATPETAGFGRGELMAQIEAVLRAPAAARPTGIFCASDSEVDLLNGALYEAGLRPGRDMAVIGCNKPPHPSRLPREARPAFIDLRVGEIGEQAARLLMDRIDGMKGPRRTLRIAPRLLPPAEAGVRDAAESRRFHRPVEAAIEETV